MLHILALLVLFIGCAAVFAFIAKRQPKASAAAALGLQPIVEAPQDASVKASPEPIVTASLKPTSGALAPESVNFHFTRECNYSCGFCFHTAKTSHVEPLENCKRAIKLLADAGMKKINFAGGEPFLHSRMLGQMCKYSKELGLTVSIISNGSLITDPWMSEYSQYLDVLGVSCDSFDEAVNVRIGRGKGQHISKIRNVAALCAKYNLRFKLNSVINAFNWEEDMNVQIAELKPYRWKVFQVLNVEGENAGAGSLRDASQFNITDAQFKDFIQRHKHNECLVPEDNSVMRTSYILLDEYLCFLDCSGGKKVQSRPILQVGVEEAMKQSGFDKVLFEQRDGNYYTEFPQKDWSSEAGCASGGGDRDIEDLFAEPPPQTL